jgi:hypothetical protein
MEILCARTGRPHRLLQLISRTCWEGGGLKPAMNDDEESDNLVVPTKRLNEIKIIDGGNRGGKWVDPEECEPTKHAPNSGSE